MKDKVVLMIEDNENVLELNRTLLMRQGCIVLSSASLRDALEKLNTNKHIDIVVLDILLPDGNGLEFIPEIRKKTHAPILLLTGKREYSDILKGLIGGGDDYMTKPYRVVELLARISALLHRQDNKSVQNEIKKGALTLDTVSQRAYLFDKDILLQPREYTTLLYLIRHENEQISVKQLYENVWKLPDNHKNTAVKSTISRLRSKIEGSGYTITSGRGIGYCFKKEV